MLTLSFLLVFLVPGNLTYAATTALFVCPVYSIKAGCVRICFCLFMLSVALSTFFSPYPLMAFWGYMPRMEGFLSLLILARLAWLYWEVKEGFGRLRAISCAGLALCSLAHFYGGSELLRTFELPWMALGTYACLTGLLLYRWNPLSCLPALSILLMSGCRGAWIAFVLGVFFLESTSLLQNSNKLNFTRKALKPFLVVLIMIFIGTLISPIGSRLWKATDISFTGARAQWTLQAVHRLQERPILGYGPDTGVHLLNPARGPMSTENSRPTRCHVLPFDLLMFYGLSGYLLALATLASALYITMKQPDPQNLTCLTVLLAWIFCGFFNPQGIPAHLIAMTALLGLRHEA